MTVENDKSGLPELRVLSVAKDLTPVSEFLSGALRVPIVQSFRDGSVHGDVYSFGVGELFVVQPVGGEGPIADFLSARGPGVMAFGSSEEAGQNGGNPLSDGGAFGAYSLQSLSDTGISLFSGPRVGLRSDGESAPLSIDHLAYVVDDLDRASEAIGSALGVAETDAIGRWTFPQFEITDAVLLFDGSYVELNHPASKEGLFGAALAHRGPNCIFMCLRADDIDATLSRIAQFGVGTLSSQKVSGIAPNGAAGEVGTVYSLSGKATQGISIMLLDGDWPWRLLRQH